MCMIIDAALSSVMRGMNSSFLLLSWSNSVVCARVRFVLLSFFFALYVSIVLHVFMDNENKLFEQ